MMKRKTSKWICGAILSVASFSNIYSQKGNNSMALTFEYTMPYFQDETGWGFSVKGFYGLRKSAQFTIATGLSIFRTVQGSRVFGETTRLMPLLFGYRQNDGRFWMEPKFGLGLLSGRIPIGGDFAKPSITALFGGISTGFAFRPFSLGVNFLGVKGIENSSAGTWHNRNFNYVAIFLGINFFKKKNFIK